MTSIWPAYTQNIHFFALPGWFGQVVRRGKSIPAKLPKPACFKDPLRVHVTYFRCTVKSLTGYNRKCIDFLSFFSCRAAENQFNDFHVALHTFLPSALELG